MIVEIKYYDIICDQCGESLIGVSNTHYPNTESAEMVAKNSGWITIIGKHYCPNCYKLGNITDKYIPKK